MANKNLVVVITGGTAGIGRATAIRFAQGGARVALLARGVDGLRATSTAIEAAGGTALGLETDVADANQVEAAASLIEQRLGPIDVWINNAMATLFAPIADTSAEEFRRATEVTYLGAVWGTMAALRRMQPRDRGVIIQVSSALAYRSIPLQAAYCGAKAALRGFSDSLRTELLHQRSSVRVSAAVLSAFNTPQFEWGRSHMPRRARPVAPVFQPAVAAEAIHWLATHPRRELRVGFPACLALAAQKFLPSLADRFAARSWEGQMRDERKSPDAPDNLFAPVATIGGERGPFDAEASASSLQLWLTRHRAWLLTIAAAACLSGCLFLFSAQ